MIIITSISSRSETHNFKMFHLSTTMTSWITTLLLLFIVVVSSNNYHKINGFQIMSNNIRTNGHGRVHTSTTSTSTSTSSSLLQESTTTTTTDIIESSPEDSPMMMKMKSKKVIAVTGATGRTGRLVVTNLLEKTNYKVIALVRDVSKANDIFKKNIDYNNNDTTRLLIQKCNLLNENDIQSIITSHDIHQVIWCSTGFSSNNNSSLRNRLSVIWNAVVKKGENTIDYIGLIALANAIHENNNNKKKQSKEYTANGPNVVMLSSAGVTRPSWSDDKKKRFEGCADIPIVRLNPFNILNIKATSEKKLRQTGTSYTIVRPTGLKDDNDWFYGSNARPIVSQGDVAVGRIHRKDVASLLVDCLDSNDVIGKTFEVFSLGGYQPPNNLEKLFKSLKNDCDIIRETDDDDDNLDCCKINEDVLEATYLAMQQLLPGEKQDAAALAMGQTYEELDAGVVGRLGVKGEEDAENVAPKPTSS